MILNRPLLLHITIFFFQLSTSFFIFCSVFYFIFSSHSSYLLLPSTRPFTCGAATPFYLFIASTLIFPPFVPLQVTFTFFFQLLLPSSPAYISRLFPCMLRFSNFFSSPCPSLSPWLSLPSPLSLLTYLLSFLPSLLLWPTFISCPSCLNLIYSSLLLYKYYHLLLLIFNKYHDPLLTHLHTLPPSASHLPQTPSSTLIHQLHTRHTTSSTSFKQYHRLIHLLLLQAASSFLPPSESPFAFSSYQLLTLSLLHTY